MYRYALALVSLMYVFTTYDNVAKAATTRYEAEKAATNIPIEKSWQGYSGTSYLCCWITNGQFATFSVTAPNAGLYTLAFGYSAGNGVASRRLTVNGNIIAVNQSFPRTANWSTWTKLAITANLVAGANTIKLDFNTATGSTQYLNLDYLDVTPPLLSTDGTISTAPNGPPLNTSAGNWTWSTAVANRPGEYNVNLNGTHAGIGTLMEVANGGKLYVNTANSGWYVWQNGFVSSAAPTPPVPITIVLTPAPQLPTSAPVGTQISIAKVTMSDGSPFLGRLATSNTDLIACQPQPQIIGNPCFISGFNIVTARTLTSADIGSHTTTITVY